MGFEQLIYPRPTEQYLFVQRLPVEGVCPKCGSNDIKRYPVSCAKGFKIATKCQACLYHLALEEPNADDKWPPFKSFTWGWNASPAEGGNKLRSQGESEHPK
jgi:rubredoxin